MIDPVHMSKMLSERAVWQDRAAHAGSHLERVVRQVLSECLGLDPEIHISEKPRDFARVYQDRWGAIPDLRVRNEGTGKSIWIEIKQQNAAGNAHERACKYFTPGLLRIAEDIGNVSRPFFFIFAGGMVDDLPKAEKYLAELSTWFDAPGWENRLLMWRQHDPVDLCEWFEDAIRPCLE